MAGPRLCAGAGHVTITSAGRYAFRNCLFPQGLEIGAFHSAAPVDVALDHVTITNTSGTPGAPDARGLSVLPGAAVAATHLRVHHTLGDAIGVLGGRLSLTWSEVWDSYGGPPVNSDHVDGVQVTSGSLYAAHDELGIDPAGRRSRMGNIHCKSDAAPARCTLVYDTIAAYGGRIAVNFQAAHGPVTGRFDHLTILTTGSTGVHVAIRDGANVSTGSLTVRA